MEEWKEYKLEDVGRITTGKTPRTSISKYFDGGIHFITPADINNPYKYIYQTSRKLSPFGLESIRNNSITKGSICVSCIGNIGYVGIATMNCSSNQQINSITVNDKFDKDYVYYAIKNLWRFFKSYEGQSTTLSILNKGQFSEIKIKAPALHTQKKIAGVLSALDDKIEVNRRINDNLEQQAQALFKSWFVDFEPFRDQPFVESELGMIPQGWRVGRYEEIIETTISGDWGKEKPEGNYVHKVACIRGCDFQDIKNGLRGNTPERYILEKNYQSKHFHHNDVLVEISGGTQTVSTGRVCPVSQLLIDKFNADIVCTNFCRVIRPIAAYAAYLYYSWLYKYNGKVMFGYENGTSGIKNFRIKDYISVEPVVIPPADLLGKFQQFVDSVQLQIQTRGSESSRLDSLRDTLLPRLMSGEIKVGDVTL